MPTFPTTRWLLALCLPALLTPITHGQSPAKVTPQEGGLSSKAHPRRTKMRSSAPWKKLQHQREHS